MVSDGQVSVDTTIMKGGAQKVRRLHEDQVIVGFAGSSADGLALFAVSYTHLTLPTILLV